MKIHGCTDYLRSFLELARENKYSLLWAVTEDIQVGDYNISLKNSTQFSHVVLTRNGKSGIVPIKSPDEMKITAYGKDYDDTIDYLFDIIENDRWGE